ncbi:MAG: glycosyltransferase [Gemmatimonas sp.]
MKASTDDPNARIVHKTDTPAQTEEQQTAFFDAVAERYAHASMRSEVHIVQIELAGVLVDLEFAGDALIAHLTPALSHIVTDGRRRAEYRICCFDTASTGSEIVPPPCPRDEFTERGDFWGMTSARIKSAFHWYEFSLNVMDLERRTGIFWVQSNRHLPSWTRASPLRTMLHWVAQATGAQLLHAAAVGTERGALLITGRGGVGKSSSALASLDAGMQYIGDDYLVARLEPEPRVFALYCTAKLDGEQLRRFPTLASHVVNTHHALDEKAVVQLVPAFSNQVVRSLPLRAVATPRFAVDDVATTTFGATTTVALQRAASFTTLAQLPGAGRGTHAFIERLVESVPGFTMHLGRDRAAVPDAIRALLDQSDDALRSLSTVHVSAQPRPLISVIVPVFNGMQFIERCVTDILKQEYSPLEILIVDDGSTDDIAQVVRSLPVDVRFFRQANGGPASARNRGLREAAGEFIAFIDVDDYWPESNLTLLAAELTADPALQLVQGSSQVVRTDVDSGEEVYLGSSADAFPHSIASALYRRSAFDTVGVFDTELRFGEDSDWFTRAREKKLAMKRVAETTLVVRRHEHNMTRGKTIKDNASLLVFKKALDRRRAEAARSQKD